MAPPFTASWRLVKCRDCDEEPSWDCVSPTIIGRPRRSKPHKIREIDGKAFVEAERQLTE